MLKKIWEWIYFGKKYRIQSFTYYIPAPPSRKLAYREKQFDKVFYQFINQGFEILSVNTESQQGVDQSGMWIIFTVRALNSRADKLDLDSFFLDQFENDQGLSHDQQEIEAIENIYQINNEDHESL